MTERQERLGREYYEKYGYGSGPIVVGPAEWYRIIRAAEEITGRYFRLDDNNSWPRIFGRECRCAVRAVETWEET
jgi:hypothetical protein